MRPVRSSQHAAPGANQALALLLAVQIPIFPILVLVPNLPQLMSHFASVAGRDFLVPMIITVPAMGLALLSPVAGALADRLGRRRLLLFALGLYTGCAVLPFVLTDLRAILTAQAGVGVAAAIIMTCGNTLLGDYFDAAGQRKWLGMQSIVVPFVSASVTIGAGALGTISWHAPFLINLTGGIAWAWVLLATWEPFEGPTIDMALEPAPGGFPWGKMSIIGLITVLTSLLYYAAALHFGLIFGALGAATPTKISVLIMLGNIGIISAGFYFRRQQKGVAANLALLYLAFAVGFIGMGLSVNYRVGLPFGIILHFGLGLTIPLLISWTLSSLCYAYRGRGMGIFMSCFFCGQFICPALMTLLGRAAGGILHSIAIVGGVCGAAAVMALLLSRPQSRAPSPTARATGAL